MGLGLGLGFKRRAHAGVASRARSDGDQPVSPPLERLLGMRDVGDVVLGVGWGRGRGRIWARVSAFLACVTLVTSCSTMPPYEWMASFTSCRG